MSKVEIKGSNIFGGNKPSISSEELLERSELFLNWVNSESYHDLSAIKKCVEFDHDLFKLLHEVKWKKDSKTTREIQGILCTLALVNMNINDDTINTILMHTITMIKDWRHDLPIVKLEA